MKEFTRVLTIEVTQIGRFGDEWAGDVEKDTLAEKNQKDATERLKRLFQADDIHVKAQLFIRDITDEGIDAVVVHGMVLRPEEEGEG